ncbi:putative acetyltransferase [Dysgonomonas sp. PFB1-18]|uniref:GNAT family N-acetyltransferase n=1 Tax=unclassified Dysgonomonas TaxID=2630389 RepID=UPI00247520E5|nr:MULTISPECIES: GNAT family N-acetyltransferase [unclassified Dysgonomonas]MDH6309901.1 putative acetyltransferase [Dysgonomonas sp. PF1-14]MDH6339445.1 putative acetyltransferase [Dysgonomonas sp. PF1-16]MDH6380945.1 putative acetyltransferase [Dysgonomonas sp. PFB1-18]MDH6397954.1 putative acetyltransferase [Dysgonomonas sp. PF1-23]
MIRFANEHTAPIVRQMWKTCFEDTEEFLDIFFTYKYKDENTLIYFEGDIAVASLQMLPYTITFYGQEIPFAYLAGLCTLPEHRQRGYMAKLIYEAHRIIAERSIVLAILIPAEDWLYGFYEKFGYEQVFEKGDDFIPLKEIMDTYADPQEGYRVLDSMFRPLDFCVQKSEEDFEAIRKEYRLDGYPPKTNLSAMARIIDVWSALSMYAKANLSQKFRIKVNDSFLQKASVYVIDKGSVELVLSPDGDYDIEVDIRLLCKLLFGFRPEETGEIYHPFFESHHPIINLMLE